MPLDPPTFLIENKINEAMKLGVTEHVTQASFIYYLSGEQIGE